MTNVRVDSFEGLLIQFCELRARGLLFAVARRHGLRVRASNRPRERRYGAPHRYALSANTHALRLGLGLTRARIASHGGDVSHYAPGPVCIAIAAKVKKWRQASRLVAGSRPRLIGRRRDGGPRERARRSARRSRIRPRARPRESARPAASRRSPESRRACRASRRYVRGSAR